MLVFIQMTSVSHRASVPFEVKSKGGDKRIPVAEKSQCHKSATFLTFDPPPPSPFYPPLSARYPAGIVGVAPGGIPAALEGLVPGGVPIAHSLPSGTHPSQAPSPNQPSKHGETREHLTEQ